MSIVHIDGFDSYSTGSDLTQEYASGSNGIANLSTTAGRFGGGALTYLGSFKDLVHVLDNPVDELWTGIAIEPTTTGDGRDACIFAFSSTFGYEVVLTFNDSTGDLKVWRGSQSTQLGSSVAVTMGTNTWHWIEVHAILDPSAGVVEVWLDGVQIINLTAQNTRQNGSATVFSQVGIGAGSSMQTTSADFDDWYILDPNISPNTGRLGDCKVETLAPTSDASPNDGTLSTGTDHFAVVDEAQWNSTDYTDLADTSGQEELFGMGDLAGSPTTIYGVRVLATIEKTDAGAMSGEVTCKSSSTETAGPSTPLLTTWAHVKGIYEVDPNTSAAWTASGVNGMSCGLKVP